MSWVSRDWLNWSQLLFMQSKWGQKEIQNLLLWQEWWKSRAQDDVYSGGSGFWWGVLMVTSQRWLRVLLMCVCVLGWSWLWCDGCNETTLMRLCVFVNGFVCVGDDDGERESTVLPCYRHSVDSGRKSSWAETSRYILPTSYHQPATVTTKEFNPFTTRYVNS